MRRSYSLIGLWLLLSALVTTLTLINPNHFVSVDSQYYLSKAGWLFGLDGDQYGHKAVGWEGDFPVAYPLLIGLSARLTGLSLLVASKLVNVLFVGLFLLIWRRRAGEVTALWMGSVFLLGGYVRIVTYTWSECVFLVLLMEWFWAVRPMVFPDTTSVSYRQAARLLLLTIGLFSLRYAGSFFVVVYGLLTVITYIRGGRPVIRQRIGPDLLYGLGMVVFILGTFYLNSRLSPWPLGTERFYEANETSWDKLSLIGLALVNELLLLRDYIPGESSLLVGVGLVLQVGLGWWLWPRLKRQRDTLPDWVPQDRQLVRVLLVSAATYLTLLFTMRLFSPFSGPNARLMAPATFPFLMLLAYWISRWNNLTARRQVAYWWAVLLVCSWLQLLPQVDLWGKLVRLVTTR